MPWESRLASRFPKKGESWNNTTDPRATSSSAKDCSARAAVAARGRSPQLSKRIPRRFASPYGPERGRQAARRAHPEEDRPRDGCGHAQGSPQIPAGFTYLGQFVDHDLTFDKTNVMLGENVTPAAAPAGPLSEPRPRLALRERAERPGVGEVLRGGRVAPEDGLDGRGRRHSGEAGVRPAARGRVHRRLRSARRSSRTSETTRTSPSRSCTSR